MRVLSLRRKHADGLAKSRKRTTVNETRIETMVCWQLQGHCFLCGAVQVSSIRRSNRTPPNRERRISLWLPCWHPHTCCPSWIYVWEHQELSMSHVWHYTTQSHEFKDKRQAFVLPLVLLLRSLYSPASSHLEAPKKLQTSQQLRNGSFLMAWRKSYSCKLRWSHNKGAPNGDSCFHDQNVCSGIFWRLQGVVKILDQKDGSVAPAASLSAQDP